MYMYMIFYPKGIAKHFGQVGVIHSLLLCTQSQTVDRKEVQHVFMKLHTLYMYVYACTSWPLSNIYNIVEHFSRNQGQEWSVKELVFLVAKNKHLLIQKQE